MIEKVVIEIKSDGNGRASEILADLRDAAETIYFPMKLVGFWDNRTGMHLCPQEDRREECFHKKPVTEPQHADYVETIQRERGGSLEVFFPHAEVVIFLR